tara:strand:- start:988 stop:2031 length:1044 start_codon:yes stop_codon:yes gene_type:complete
MAYTTVNDPSAHFQATQYTGSSSSVNVINDGNSNLQPDLIWVKRLNGANDHNIFDTNRGLDNRQWTNLASTSTTGTSVAALTDGFSTGTYWGDVNSNGNTFISWQWKANGGTTSSNTDGSITSTVQANTTAGFSIVTWTGTGSNGTVGHGLGAAPDMILFKNYGAGENWTTYHEPLTAQKGMYLNLDNKENTASSWYQDTAPTSSVFSVGTNAKTNGGTMMAYCFKNIKGYSHSGIYKGNGSASIDGVFVYTGFKPAFIMTKLYTGTTTGGEWSLKDYGRNPFNVASSRLQANTNAAANTDWYMDILSNGFQWRDSGGSTNGADNQYIFYAVAQQSLVANNTIGLAR